MQRHSRAIPATVPLNQVNPVAVLECVDRPEVAQVVWGKVFDANLLAQESNPFKNAVARNALALVAREERPTLVDQRQIGLSRLSCAA